MIRFILLFLFQVLLTGFVIAQNTDTSSVKRDSKFRGNDQTARNSQIKDSVGREPLMDTAWMLMTSQYPGKNFIEQAYRKNPFFGFLSRPLVIRSDIKEFNGKEVLFYVLVALLLLFALIKFSFPKYINDLFSVAFRTTLKRRQIGEQLIQTPLPSLLLNLFFLITAALYIDFLLQQYHLATGQNFWILYFYCFVFLVTIYLVKFLSLKFSGWLFNISETTDGYIFIVFMINKIIAIFLLPVLVLVSFSEGAIRQVSFTLSYVGVIGLLGYRFILSYALVRNQVRVNPFHFILYICVFELAPLLLIYKVLLRWF